MTETIPNPEEHKASERHIIEMDIEDYSTPKPEVGEQEESPQEMPAEPLRPEDTPEPGLEIPQELPEEEQPNIEDVNKILEKINGEEVDEEERNRKIEEILKKLRD